MDIWIEVVSEINPSILKGNSSKHRTLLKKAARFHPVEKLLKRVNN